MGMIMMTPHKLDLSLSLMVIDSKHSKSTHHRDVCASLGMAVLCTTASTWEMLDEPLGMRT